MVPWISRVVSFGLKKCTHPCPLRAKSGHSRECFFRFSRALPATGGDVVRQTFSVYRVIRPRLISTFDELIVYC